MDGWKTILFFLGFGLPIFKGKLAASFREGHLYFVIVNPGYVEKKYLDEGWRRARAGECTLAAVGGADVQRWTLNNVVHTFFIWTSLNQRLNFLEISRYLCEILRSLRGNS